MKLSFLIILAILVFLPIWLMKKWEKAEELEVENKIKELEKDLKLSDKVVDFEKNNPNYKNTIKKLNKFKEK